MRVSFFPIVLALLVLSCGTSVRAQTSTPNQFTANLSLGSQNSQVTALQQMLNRDPSTRIASSGPGSAGYETNYFGALTKAAVVRFQEKYASETLAPVGLLKGSGYVGPYTRAKLNALSVSIPATAPAATTETKTSAPAPTGSGQATASQNPNLQNIDVFLAAIDTVGAAQGYSAANLAIVKTQVIKDMATTTDLRAAFVKMVQKSSPQSILQSSLGGKVLASIGHTFDSIFMPGHARAAGGTPFGGALLSSFWCTCSFTWLITIQSLPPTYAALLTYEPGSQAYLSYNIPATNWLLGEYAPGGGVCLIFTGNGCLSLPSQGMITPTVGSSGL